MFVCVNNQIIPASEATIHISDLAIQRGYGIFDFFKVQDGHAFFLDDYLDRFFHSADVMRLSIPLTREELTGNISLLIEKNNVNESGIKMILTGGYSTDGFTPAKPNLIMTQHPLVLPGGEIIQKGVKIITHEYIREFPEAKTINYTMGIWLMKAVNEQQAADVLYVKDGIVSEFPRSNFFIVRPDKTVATPARNVLKGVTRKNILTIAGENFKAVEGDITLDEVYNASEAFITSTTKRIIPIVQVNDRIIGMGKPGAVSQTLLQKLVDLENHNVKKILA